MLGVVADDLVDAGGQGPGQPEDHRADHEQSPHPATVTSQPRMQPGVEVQTDDHRGDGRQSGGAEKTGVLHIPGLHLGRVLGIRHPGADEEGPCHEDPEQHPAETDPPRPRRRLANGPGAGAGAGDRHSHCSHLLPLLLGSAALGCAPGSTVKGVGAAAQGARPPVTEGCYHPGRDAYSTLRTVAAAMRAARRPGTTATASAMTTVNKPTRATEPGTVGAGTASILRAKAIHSCRPAAMPTGMPTASASTAVTNACAATAAVV